MEDYPEEISINDKLIQKMSKDIQNLNLFEAFLTCGINKSDLVNKIEESQDNAIKNLSINSKIIYEFSKDNKSQLFVFN